MRILVSLVVGLMSFAGVGAPSTPVGVDDFTFDSFDGQYVLDVDATGHSMLRTTETLVADFPSVDQNHGIVRALPTAFDGHDTDVKVLSVTDETGAPRDFTLAPSGDALNVRIGDTTHFVQGRQTYVITYTQRDVTGYSGSGSDQFVWDTNGSGWAQPFSSVTAHLAVSPTLSAALTGATGCYQGPAGSIDPCTIAAAGDGFDAAATDLGPGENMTIVVGFAPNTFATASAGTPLPYPTPPGSNIGPSPGTVQGIVNTVLITYAVVFGVAILLGLAFYIVMSIALMGFFRKVGVEPWIAWVPIYNNWKWLEVGGQNGMLSLLVLIPYAGIVTSVFLYIGMWRTGIAFGKRDAGWLVLGIFLPFVWCFLLARPTEVYRPEWIMAAGYPPPRAGYGSMQPAPAFTPQP